MAETQQTKPKSVAKKLPQAGAPVRLPRAYAQPSFRIAKPPVVRPPARPAK